MTTIRSRRKFLPFTLVLLAMTALSSLATAHEIPVDVVVRSYLVPDGRTLNLIVRVPLDAMRDVNFPTRGPGYIDLAAADETLHDAATIWVGNEVRVYENGEVLDEHRLAAVRLSLPAQRPFRNYEAALRHVTGPPLTPDTDISRDQAMLDVLIQYPIASAASAFSIEPRFRRLGLRTTTILTFRTNGGTERVFEFHDDPGLVDLDPSWLKALGRFVVFGFEHIMDGTDHLMFIMCLIIPFRRVRPLIAIVTSFTVAHSITLIGSAYGTVPSVPWFPPLIESLIAASIVYMALENILGSRWERRWLIAFGFGLVHGFGFSFALKETLQFAGGHLLTSLLGFNLGVELGQLLLVIVAVPLLSALFRAGLPERTGTIVLSALLAHSGWHWMTERFADLAAYNIDWRAMFASITLAGSMRFAMMLMIVGCVLWVMFTLYKRLLPAEARSTG